MLKKNMQIANLALECPEYGGAYPPIKGCVFNPPLYLTSDKYYLIVVTSRLIFVPETGFYFAPTKNKLIWVKKFRLLQVSMSSPAGMECWAFEAIEGDPPKNVVPYVWGKRPSTTVS